MVVRFNRDENLLRRVLVSNVQRELLLSRRRSKGHKPLRRLTSGHATARWRYGSRSGHVQRVRGGHQIHRRSRHRWDCRAISQWRDKRGWVVFKTKEFNQRHTDMGIVVEECLRSAFVVQGESRSLFFHCLLWYRNRQGRPSGRNGANDAPQERWSVLGGGFPGITLTHIFFAE